MTAMNPYAFRGWHLPSYADGANCDRNYHMYGSWPSGYFTPASVYPITSESQKQHVNGDWKIPSTLCSSTSDGSPNRDSSLLKSGYEGLIYKSNGCRNDNDPNRDESQRSCCAISCSCNSNPQRLNMLENSWRGSEIPGAIDFNKAGLSPYQSICQRRK
ncbi:hypothetical protein ACJMK2_021483 [Sinanodonta woodiana]|uniref:Uncharacterized protein n=2 Tax=Sinanodonta woodiana TaxID=1069815 RepID=A0ABD3TG80_SINWO